jgi:hypothetical protein
VRVISARGEVGVEVRRGRDVSGPPQFQEAEHGEVEVEGQAVGTGGDDGAEIGADEELPAADHAAGEVVVAVLWAEVDRHAVRGRRANETDIARARREFMELVGPGELDANPALAASALAFAALHAVQQALPEYRSSALGRLGRTEEAEAEARRAYATEQNRRWFRANPNGADAIAAATKAADAARERTAQYLLVTRLEQLREQAAVRTEAARPAPWTDRLPEFAARRLDGDTAGAVIA